MSLLDKMKKASKSVVDAGAKQMLKVRQQQRAVRMTTEDTTMTMTMTETVQNSFYFTSLFVDILSSEKRQTVFVCNSVR
jgi:hypothetical protein